MEKGRVMEQEGRKRERQNMAMTSGGYSVF